MQKKSSKLVLSKLSLLLDIRNNTRRFNLVIRNGWGIKFSIYRDTNILLIITSTYTGQTAVRYFNDEDDAVDYINYVTAHSPEEEIEV